MVYDRFPLGLESGDLNVNGSKRLFVVNRRGCRLEAIVIVPAAGHVRGAGSIVFAGLAIDPLPFVAPVIDPLRPAGFCQRLVGQPSPPFAGLLDPRRSVKRPALSSVARRRVRDVQNWRA